jgi:hypothetical protein
MKPAMPDISFRVPARGEVCHFQNQQEGPIKPIKRAEFLTFAWKLANDKARELGWIV